MAELIEIDGQSDLQPVIVNANDLSIFDSSCHNFKYCRDAQNTILFCMVIIIILMLMVHFKDLLRDLLAILKSKRKRWTTENQRPSPVIATCQDCLNNNV